MPNTQFDVIVIGEGISGLTAAKHAAQLGRSVATFEPNLFGGLVINVNELHGGPPGTMTSGTDLASNLMQEAAELGVASHPERVTALGADRGAITVATESSSYRAGSVIVCSGASLKRLGIPGEAEFDHRGVSQCADCDGPLFKGEDAVVVGGGDSALQEALVLAQWCKSVHLVHRGAQFRARAHFVEAVTRAPNIGVRWRTVIEEILGAQNVAKVRARHTDSGEVFEIPCAGVFAYVGLAPNSEFLPAAIERDERGFAITGADLQTALRGVFAAGAVRAGYSGQLADAVREAQTAARAAHELLGTD